jgi:hypothetical protein
VLLLRFSGSTMNCTFAVVQVCFSPLPTTHVVFSTISVFVCWIKLLLLSRYTAEDWYQLKVMLSHCDGVWIGNMVMMFTEYILRYCAEHPRHTMLTPCLQCVTDIG